MTEFGQLTKKGPSSQNLGTLDLGIILVVQVLGKYMILGY